MLSSQKIKNGGLTQDDDENIFYFSHNYLPFGFFGLVTLFLFYFSILNFSAILNF
jgi:hypothetical protein